MRLTFPITLCLALAVPAAVSAHSGGLNSEGCHNNRKTGDYHCHRGDHAPSRSQRTSQYRNDTPRFNLTPRDDVRPSGAFRNCNEARAAGAAPVRRGDPGYGPHLDRDNDGIGCEPYRGR